MPPLKNIRSKIDASCRDLLVKLPKELAKFRCRAYNFLDAAATNALIGALFRSPSSLFPRRTIHEFVNQQPSHSDFQSS